MRLPNPLRPTDALTSTLAVEVIFMADSDTPPALEFTLRVQPATPQTAGRYTLTGLSPGETLVFHSAADLTRFLEWVAAGRPKLH